SLSPNSFLLQCCKKKASLNLIMSRHFLSFFAVLTVNSLLNWRLFQPVSAHIRTKYVCVCVFNFLFPCLAFDTWLVLRQVDLLLTPKTLSDLLLRQLSDPSKT